MTERSEDWPLRLDAAVEAARSRPFAWRVHDCCAFASAVVEAMTGRDVMAELRDEFGDYASELGAAKAIARAGGLRAAWTHALGEPIAPAFAQRGDVVLILNEGRELIGVNLGTAVCAVSEAGLGFVSGKEVVCAWRV